MNENNITSAILFDAEKKAWLSFTNPVKIISTRNLDEVLDCLQKTEEEVSNNKLYAVGFVCYEASPAFDEALKVNNEKNFMPLLWFALFDKYEVIDLPIIKKQGKYFGEWEMSVTEEEYDKKIADVKHNIYEGNTYQVNYTTRQYADFKGGNPFELFCELAITQKAKYSTFIDCEDFTICSASPELFFSYNDRQIISKPMKGTAKRKFLLEEDKMQAEWLHESIKNRAENVMILDMIRNDIGRIAESGSVHVTEKFQVEKYPTVWQMTSTVEAKTSAKLTDIFKALFPCSSITGAPKAYTMKIISELENTSRGVYTGAVGFITPENRAQFNVAIRTLVINKKLNIAEFGVGGGIVWDSTDKGEYEECKIKSKFLNERQLDFSLLESILWTREEGYFLLDYHLRRIKRAAVYFDYPIDLENVIETLEKIKGFFEEDKYKIRLLVNVFGKIKCEFNSLPQNYKTEDPNVVIASESINTNTPFVYYKTTNRSIYNRFKEKYSNYYDVILWNKNKEITETTVGNLVIELNDGLFTPPLKSGLLAGTFREYLLAVGKIKEKRITIDELKEADNVYLINSVRKWIKLNVIS
jgi:para-aminobenzoate synthetase / 4-amino-4-deoxychorismate lyase